jgi:hypothetical protein
MAKVSLRVPLPFKYPDKLVDLMKGVVKKHEALAASSPLNNPSFIDMADFKAKLLAADELREKSIAARADAEAYMAQARMILGTAIGQSINTTGTLYFLLDLIKRILLVKYRGQEENLSMYGFEVVIGSTKPVGPKKKGKKGK